MRIVLTVVLTLCFACGVAFGGAANYATGDQDQKVAYQTKIPNATLQDEDVNGRPQHMDTDDRTAEELNSVERTIIRRDTIITNRQNLQNRAGE
jgi:hypothetical protein